jgi:hypothetical protein
VAQPASLVLAGLWVIRHHHQVPARRALLMTLLSAAVALGLTLPAAALRASALPDLRPDGVGSVIFGVSKARAVASLSKVLGRPSAAGVSRACGARFTEVAWHDLIAQFANGTFTGYRFIEGGWPLWTSQTLHQRPSTAYPQPPLETARGITLGSTLGELRSAYGALERSGAVEWTAANGLRFIESSTVVNTRSPRTKIVEIHIDTCGTDQ